MIDHKTIEITCQCQQNIKVPPSWCDLAQCQQLCAGCIHNEGRKASKYHEQKAKARKEGGL